MNTTSKTKNTAWFGGSFSVIPFDAVLDKRLKPRQLKVLLILAKHADRSSGIAYPSLDRIAEMCGFFSNGLPDRALVSRLISNESGKGTGPGLVQLGYVKKLGWLANRTSQSYRLQCAHISVDDLNQPTNRQKSEVEAKTELEAKKERRLAKERADAEAYFSEFEDEKYKDAVIEMPVMNSPQSRTVDCEYTKNDVQQAFRDGTWGDIPRHIVEHYGFRYSFAE
ncbi:hypothetical protein ABIB38_002796 [Massilia sp. UYP11]|uniref:helix-turn-helix domain-containing protein n=1 Tax=Massilia sp. UYP11 TaxID=1756385 RepID=UPI003D21A3F2